MRNRFGLVPRVASVFIIAATLARAEIALENNRLALRFDDKDGYALSGVLNKAKATEHLAPRPEGDTDDRALWVLQFRDAAGATHSVTPAVAASAKHELGAGELRITWDGVKISAIQADVKVVATVRLPADSATATWTIEVQGAAGAALWQVDFPRVCGIRGIGDDQMSSPQYLGRLLRDPVGRKLAITLAYPQPASMQFLAFWGTPDKRTPDLDTAEGVNPETGWRPDFSDAAGLYFATQDGAQQYKRFGMKSGEPVSQMRWWIEHVPPVHAWPIPAQASQAVNYTPPYATVLGVFTGDYHEAAAMYLDWARGQGWCRRGPVDTWPGATPAACSEALTQFTPVWFRDIAFWTKFYHEPAKVVPEWAAYRKWLQVPMASHYYRYNVSFFDNNGPEYLPGDPYLLEGLRDACNLGLRPLPYILATNWDTDTQSWFREDAFKSTMKNESGEFRPWQMSTERFAWMCPATEPWRAKMRETCGKLIGEQGAAGIYLDVLAAGSAMTCYDPTHGHDVHGGNYQGLGNRQLMHDLRREIRKLDPDASFFTEEIDEIFMDCMDGFLTLDISRSWNRPGEQVWPVFNAVYHPYTIDFGSDATLEQKPELFALFLGMQFTWGMQILNSSVSPAPPAAGQPTSEMLRDVVQAYHLAGRKFLQGGTWARITVRPKGGTPGTTGLELAADRHVVKYSGIGKQTPRLWTGPAVMASAWTRGADIGVVLVNVTDKDQDVELTVRAEKLNLPAATRLVRAWPQPVADIEPAAGTHPMRLPAYTAAIGVLTTKPDQAVHPAWLDETPWELLAVESGTFPPITGPGGSLWTCSDGPVLNRADSAQTAAQAGTWDASGTLQPREGLQAPVRGIKAEGQGLPRDTDQKPFLLLRQLRHTVKTAASVDVTVLSGDAWHLLCQAPGGAEFALARPGLVVVSDTATGSVVHSISEPATDRITLPPGGPYLVGYAAFDAAEIGAMLNSRDASIVAKLKPFADRLVALAAPQMGERVTELAALSRDVVALAGQFRDLPGALRPGNALAELHRRLQALVSAQTATHAHLTARHAWLSCGVRKGLSFAVHGPAAALGTVAKLDLTPVGNWPADGLRVEGLDQPPRRDAPGLVEFRPALDLKAGLYVERLVPVVGAVTVTAAGTPFCLSDIFYLEADRPCELITQADPVVVVAGRQATGEVTLRNWSPDDVQLTFNVSGPEGWAITAEPATAPAPAFKDVVFKVQIAPPVGTPPGEQRIRCTANHLSQGDTELLGELRASVHESVGPLVAVADAWPQPAPESLARIRQRGLLAVCLAAGEELKIEIRNVRVTTYTTKVSYRLLDPDLCPLDSGEVAVDESKTLVRKAEVAGTYYLEVTPGTGSTAVNIANRCAAEVASRTDRLSLFHSPIERYFFVPTGAKRFALGAKEGGPTETAHFVVTSPTGRVAFEKSDLLDGRELEIEVKPDEAGKVWKLRVEPVEDISVWLTGDVCPYLSTAPERVLAPTSGMGR